MIINLGDAPFKAFITVTYPNGTCTVSLGDKSFTHTGGDTHTFTVNKKGTWTVRATRSDGTAESKTVSLSTRGQTVSVTLTCPYYLFKSGSGKLVDFTSKAAPLAFTAEHIQLNVNNVWDNVTSCHTSSPINLTSYKTLKFDVSPITASSNGSHPRPFFGANKTEFTGWNTLEIEWRTGTSTSSRQTISIDVNSANEFYYIGFGGVVVGYIYNIWLE